MSESTPPILPLHDLVRREWKIIEEKILKGEEVCSDAANIGAAYLEREVFPNARSVQVPDGIFAIFSLTLELGMRLERNRGGR